MELHTGKRTRLEQLSRMEIGNKVFCMVKFHGGEPGKFVISVFCNQAIGQGRVVCKNIGCQS